MTCGISESDAQFFGSILARVTDEYSKKAPGTPITKVQDEAKRIFDDLRWINEIKRSYLTIDINDYEKMNDIYGPDLTAIPRQRFQDFKTSTILKTDRPLTIRAYSGYTIFQREKYPELEGDFREKSRKVAQLWKQLTDDEKKIYNEKAKQPK